MKVIMLGIGDYGSTKTPGELLKTMALGSCVALIIIDPVSKMIGMDHIALPDSKINKEKSERTPGYFADTGIKSLINEMKAKGMKGSGTKLIVKMIGGAKVMDANNTFNIGKRNIMAIKKILWKYGMGVRSEDVGGTISRTVSIDSDRGKVTIVAPGKEPWSI